MSKVAVIVPVYNVANYLKECLDSIINQTLSDIEIICVNDGSTDNSLDILDDYAQNDNRIKVITKKNDGLGMARNTGMEYVTAPLVFFVDSDDYLPLDAIEKLYNFYEQTKADLIISKMQIFENITNKQLSIRGYNNKFLPEKEVFNIEDIGGFAYQLIMQSACAKLFSVNVIKKYNLKFHKCRMHEDLSFTYTYVAIAQSISVLDEITYFYRASRPGSLVFNNKQTDSWKDFSLAFDLLEKNLKKYGMFKKMYKTYFNSLIHIILGHLKNIGLSHKINLIKYLRQNYSFIRNEAKETYYNELYFYIMQFFLMGV